MRVVLVHLIENQAEKYHQGLVKSIGPKFGENYMIENPLPAHITLKSPFETKDLKGIEGFVKEFADNTPKTQFEFGDFGNFEKFVIFLKVKLSKSALNIQKKLIKDLEKINIKAHKFDKNFKPHATIVYGNTKKSFTNIWNHIKTLKKRKFKLKLDNITILKKVRNRWRVHKIFKLK